MEASSELTQIKRCLSNRTAYAVNNKANRISNDTVTSSTDLQKLPKKEKASILNKSIEQQISKAKLLISHAKQRVENDKTLTKNAETLP